MKKADNVPKTIALDLLSKWPGTKNLAALLDEIGAATRDTQRELGDEAVRGNLARIAQLAEAARSDCTRVGAAGLAARLARIEARARSGEMTNPLAELDGILGELDTFVEALERRPERKR